VIAEALAVPTAALHVNTTRTNITPVDGPLLQRINEVCLTNSAMRLGMQSAFGAPSFQLAYGARLDTPSSQLAGRAHIDNCADDGAVAVVPLRDGQAPTELTTYNGALPYSTDVQRPCSACGKLRILTNAAARDRSYLKTVTHTCSSMGYKCTQPATTPTKMMLESLGGLLEPNALLKDMLPCAGLEHAGSALVTLPTAVHRVPEVVQSTGTVRSVLFLYFVPIYGDVRDGLDSPRPYDRDKQYHVDQLLDDTRLSRAQPERAARAILQYNELGYDVTAEGLPSNAALARTRRNARLNEIRQLAAALAAPSSRLRSHAEQLLMSPPEAPEEPSADGDMPHGLATHCRPRKLRRAGCHAPPRPLQPRRRARR